MLMVLAVGGCAGPRQWEKPGADREMANQDLRDCRRAAAIEARRIYPGNVPMRYPSPISSPHLSGRFDPYYVRRDTNDRVTNEVRLAGSCMRNKGYEFNQLPTEVSPTSRPRST